MSSDATRTERSDSGADGGHMPSGNSSTSGMPGKPSLIRSVSHNSSVESYRQTIAEMISQIRYAQAMFHCIVETIALRALCL
jgi:hypothetical protein